MYVFIHTLTELQCHSEPTTIIRYFPVKKSISVAVQLCRLFNGEIPTTTQCVRENFPTTGASVAWLRDSKGTRGRYHLATDSLFYDTTYRPEHKHSVVCRISPGKGHHVFFRQKPTKTQHPPCACVFVPVSPCVRLRE